MTRDGAPDKAAPHRTPDAKNAGGPALRRFSAYPPA
jgi:hypothetical protein